MGASSGAPWRSVKFDKEGIARYSSSFIYLSLVSLLMESGPTWIRDGTLPSDPEEIRREEKIPPERVSDEATHEKDDRK